MTVATKTRTRHSVKNYKAEHNCNDTRPGAYSYDLGKRWRCEGCGTWYNVVQDTVIGKVWAVQK